MPTARTGVAAPAARTGPAVSAPGYVWRDHVLDVPLDHRDPAGERISVYGREVARPGPRADERPMLVFLQGGPGHRADRPTRGHHWLGRALDEFRVLLLDQRGTGRSSPATGQTLPARGDSAVQAEYLTHFRADAIVADAEAFRSHLLGPDGRWSVLGQSFGGFCATSYLSQAPEHLAEVLITGGLPGLTATADEVYRAAYPRVRGKNEAFFARNPGDADTVRRICSVLDRSPVLLPDGSRLSSRRFRTIGLELGTDTGFDALHFLLEDPFAGLDVLSDAFLAELHGLLSHARHPLFAVLHEPIYAQGAATRWAAERVRAEFAEFDPDPGQDAPMLLTGEMIYPWMFAEDPALVPLAEVADALAEHGDWPALYDSERLAGNDVPVAAAVYHDDMYVDRDMSLVTAASIRGLRTWVTDEFEHDGLRVGDVLDKLLRLVRGQS